jgi:hypothetical protein
MQPIRSSPKVLSIAALLIVGACAAPVPRAAAAPLTARAGSHEIEVLIEGAPAPQFFHAGEQYVLGMRGARYTLRVWNRSYDRVEAVVSVDGLDVIDGKPADYREKRGYVIQPGGFVDIDGWRLSGLQAAAFRFGSVRESYAARTSGARNVGVIGVALFPERRPPIAWPRPPHRRYPWPPPSYHPMDESAKAAPAAEASDAAGSSAAAPPPASPSSPPPSSPPPSSSPRSSDPAPRSGSAEAPRARRGHAEDDSLGGMASGRVPTQRPGLGTEFGEPVDSAVEQVSFVRADRATPKVLLGLRYNDRAGLLAIGIDVDGVGHDRLSDERLRRSADPFPASDRAYASPPPGWRR